MEGALGKAIVRSLSLSRLPGGQDGDPLGEDREDSDIVSCLRQNEATVGAGTDPGGCRKVAQTSRHPSGRAGRC